MIKSAILLLLALFSATALATDDIATEKLSLEDNNAIEGVTQSLRGASAPKNDRDLLYLCSAIEGLFGQEEVDCTCNYRWLFGELKFKCRYRKYRCVEEAPATRGQVCAIPTMEGNFRWFLFQLKYEASGKICNTRSWANNTLGGDFFMGDLCLDMAAQSGLTVSTGLKSCGADFFGVTCDSCKRCTYDAPRSNRTGVSLKCSNIRVDPCFPFEIPLFVTNAKEQSLNPVDFVADTLKNDLLFSSLLMRKAKDLVNEALRN